MSILNKPRALPVKPVPRHPRLSPIPCIHFDHYNSSVSDLPGPGPDAESPRYYRKGLFLGTCLNFMVDDAMNVYAFGGRLDSGGLETTFFLALFDDQFRIVAKREVARLRTLDILRGQLPMNLGYFVMDALGRVIIVRDRNTVAFLKHNNHTTIEEVLQWPLAAPLARAFATYSGPADRLQIANQNIAQILPAYTHGYWAVAFGKGTRATGAPTPPGHVPAYLAFLADDGTLLDTHVFDGEVIENGVALDASGIYVVTDWALYKFAVSASGAIEPIWRTPYQRAGYKKPGTLSAFGSGASPTLQGMADDLITLTDNADDRINLLALDRTTGRVLCQCPLFRRGASANENTVIGYGDTVIAQNWYNAPGYSDSLNGLEPGLVRLDIRPDRSALEEVWYNHSFATTATARLSTHTGLIYGAVQVGGRDRYAMAYVDFETGLQSHGRSFGKGVSFRIAMSPAYLLDRGRLIQPTRTGFSVIDPV